MKPPITNSSQVRTDTILFAIAEWIPLVEVKKIVAEEFNVDGYPVLAKVTTTTQGGSEFVDFVMKNGELAK